MTSTRWTATLLLTITFAALRGSPQSSGQSTNQTIDRAWLALTDSAEHMHAAMMSTPPSHNGDVDFVRLMLPHHQGAIDMSKVQLMYGKDPQIRRLAQEIITDQQTEIELMRLWLKQHEVSGGIRTANPNQEGVAP